MKNRNLLEAKMLEKNIKHIELAKALGFETEQPIYKRLQGNVDWKLHEVNKVRRYLGLTMEQADAIFYTEE